MVPFNVVQYTTWQGLFSISGRDCSPAVQRKELGIFGLQKKEGPWDLWLVEKTTLLLRVMALSLINLWQRFPSLANPGILGLELSE